MKNQISIPVNFDPNTFKYKFLRDGNIKLGDSIATWSTLKGDEEIWIEQLGLKVLGTCKNCSVCTKDCYVNKSYVRYPTVPYGHARNTLGLRLAFDKVFKDLDNQIKRARNPIKIVRINQSGEVEDQKQMLGWCNLAKNNPKTIFYMYTKMYDIATEVLLSNKVPNNLVILFSIWHDLGVKEFEAVRHLPNVKAFVYDDGNIQIKPQVYCKAYDDKGHLNHEETCQQCGKCFGKNPKMQIVGCKGH